MLVARPGADPALLTAGIDALHDETRVRVVGAELGLARGLATSSASTSCPVALEVPRGDDRDVALADVAHRARARACRVVAKLRTGPTPTWPWPDEAEVAAFLGPSRAPRCRSS